jgi:hypothetical protein
MAVDKFVEQDTPFAGGMQQNCVRRTFPLEGFPTNGVQWAIAASGRSTVATTA